MKISLMCGVVGVALAPMALGSITVTSGDRQLNAGARAFDQTNTPLSVLNLDTSGNFMFTHEAGAADSDDSSDALGRAIHDTTLGTNAIFGGVSVEARANNFGPQPDVWANASQTFMIQFTLAAPTEIRFEGTFDASAVAPPEGAGASSSVNFMLFGFAFPAGMPLGQTTGGAGAHDFTLMLGAGPYFINGAIDAMVDVSGNLGSAVATARYDFSYTVVPTPGAAALFGVGGVILLRRRR